MSGNLWFKSGLDNTQLKKDVGQAQTHIKGLSDKVQSESVKMNSSFSGIGAGIAAIGGVAAITMLGKEILDTTAKFEKFGIVLSNTLGAVKGQAALDMLSNFAATTPFQLDEVTGAFIKMANQGFVPTQAEMIKLGDIASTMGKGLDQLTEGILDAQTGEFERLKEFGIKASQNGDKVTFSFREQQTTVAKTNSAIRGYILSLGDLKGVTGANALISASLTGQISNMADKLAFAFNSLGKENKGLLYDMIGGASLAIDNYEAIGKVIMGLVATYGAYKAAILITNAVKVSQIAINELVIASGGLVNAKEALSILIKEKLTLATLKQTAAQLGLNVAILMNPYVLATMAVIALGTAMWVLYDGTTAAERAQKALNDRITEQSQSSDEERSNIEKNITAIKDETTTRQEKQRALQILQNLYPDIFKNLNIEKIKNLELAAAIKLVNIELEKKNGKKDSSDLADINDVLKSNPSVLFGEGAWTDETTKKAQKLLGDKVSWHDSNETLAKKLTAERDAILLKQANERHAEKQAQFDELTNEKKIEYLKNENKELEAQQNSLKKIGELGKIPIENIEKQIAKNKGSITEYAAGIKEMSTYDQKQIVAQKELLRLQNERKVLEGQKLSPAESEKQFKDIDAQISKQEGILKKSTALAKAGESAADKAKKKAQEIADATLKISNDTATAGLANQQATLDNQTKLDNLLEDGFVKKQKLIDDNHAQALLDIKKKAQGLLVAQQEAEKDVWKLGGSKGVFKPTTTLNAVDQSTLTTEKNTVEIVFLANTKDLMTSFRDSYQSIDDERRKIDKKYNDDVLAFLNDNNSVKVGESDLDRQARIDSNNSAIKVATEQNKLANEAIDKTIADKQVSFQIWINEIAAMGMKELVKSLEEAKTVLENSTTVSDDEKAVLRAKITALQAQIKTQQVKEGSPAQKTQKEWESTLKTMNDVNEAVKNIISSISGLDEPTKTALTAATNVAGGVIAMITGIQALGKAAAATLSTVETASVILAIIGAAISIISTIIGLFTAAAEKEAAKVRAIAESERTYFLNIVASNEELRKQYEWTKKIGEATIDYIKREGEELKNQKNANEKDFTDTFAQLQNQWWKSGAENYGRWFDGLSLLTGKTFEQIGELSKKGLLTPDAEALYQKLLTLQKEGVDIEKMQLEYLQKIKELNTGTTAQSITDSIIEGFKNGKRSAADFADTFQQLMQGAVIAALQQATDVKVLKWYEDFATAAADGIITPEERATLLASWNQIILDTKNKTAQLEGLTGTSLSTDATRTATAKGIATASQESVDENNGRLTSIQGNMSQLKDCALQINESVKILAANSPKVLETLMGIKGDTARLAAIEQGISDINMKGIYLKV